MIPKVDILGREIFVAVNDTRAQWPTKYMHINEAIIGYYRQLTLKKFYFHSSHNFSLFFFFSKHSPPPQMHTRVRDAECRVWMREKKYLKFQRKEKCKDFLFLLWKLFLLDWIRKFEFYQKKIRMDWHLTCIF